MLLSLLGKSTNNIANKHKFVNKGPYQNLRFLTCFRKIWSPFQKSCAGQYGAAACFYIILSFPSFVSIFLLISKDFPAFYEALFKFLHDIMPHELYDWVKNNILLFPQKKSQISIAIITALCSRIARMAPMAMTSAMANTAVHCTPFSSACFMLS